MQSQVPESRASREPILNTAIRVAAFIVMLIAAFSILIMGIFATNSESPDVIVVGLGVILAAIAGLSLMIIARLAARPFVSGGDRIQRRKALWITVAIYGVGVPAMMFGTWQCVSLWTNSGIYQEAAIEAPNSIPQF